MNLSRSIKNVSSESTNGKIIACTFEQRRFYSVFCTLFPYENTQFEFKNGLIETVNWNIMWKIHFVQK